MTIEELYLWAVKNNVTDGEIVIRDSFGDRTDYIEPTIVEHNGYIEVEL